MIPAEEFNPYQAPTATLESPSRLELNGDAEIIRRTYLNHEAAVKSIGSLCYLGALFCGLGAIFGVLTLSGFVAGVRPPDAQAMMAMALNLGILFVFCLIYSALGFGLNRLQPWARWTTIVLIGLATLYQLGLVIMAVAFNPAVAGMMLGVALLCLIIPTYMLYLLISAKGSMVFSSEYRDVIQATPHVKYKTSLFLKILLVLLLIIVVTVIVAAVARNSVPQ